MIWYEQAMEKLNTQYDAVIGNKEAVMKQAVRDALMEFCRQDEEFAQAVVQGGTFADCMEAVARGVGRSISDLEAYKKAVRYYFDGATISVEMCIHLTGGEDGPAQRGIVLDLADFL